MEKSEPLCPAGGNVRRYNPYRTQCGSSSKIKNRIVTESKPVLLATGLANTLRDKFGGQGIMTLFGNPADREDDGLAPPNTISPESELRLLLYHEGRGCGWWVTISWCQNPLLLQ